MQLPTLDIITFTCVLAHDRYLYFCRNMSYQVAKVCHNIQLMGCKGGKGRGNAEKKIVMPSNAGLRWEEKLKKARLPTPVRKAANQIIISHVFLEQKIPNIIQDGRKAVVLSY